MNEDLLEIFNKANSKHPSEAYKDFRTEPINELANYYRFNNINLELKDALRFNITQLVETDIYYRYNNHSDIAINFVGESGTGKSNQLLHYNLLWADVTTVPFRTSSVTWSQPEFNLMLRGMKMRVYKDTEESTGSRITIEERPLDKGESLSLDEASDQLIAGALSLTVSLQTGDIENRIRALQVARFCAGVRQILHSAYYNMEVIRRDTVDRAIYSIVYKDMKDANGTWRRTNLGYVRIPYVPLHIFEHYNKYKIESIHQFGKSVGTNRIAQLINYLAKKLWDDEDFQRLPLKPNSARMNWMQRNPKISIFPTVKFYEQLYNLSLNKDLHEQLTKKEKHLHQYDESDKAGDNAGG
jgi:hypothetical protein